MMGSERVTFDDAAECFLDAVELIGDDDWDRSALGEWSVRDLVGHTSRALLTVEAYLGIEPQPGAPRVHDAAGYYIAAMGSIGDPALVAQRGRDAGAALGDEPGQALADLATRVLTLVASTPGTADVATPVGTMTLDAYLPTRTFELAVHTLDLIAALDLDATVSDSVLEACLGVAASLAARRGDGARLLRALTGRERLGEGYSIL